MSKTIIVPARYAVIRLLGKKVRIQTPEFNGYGVVMAVDNDGDQETATIECMEEYHG